MKLQYVLGEFNEQTDAFVASYPIRGLSLIDLQAMFDVEASNPMFDGFPVTERQQEVLEKATGVLLDLSRSCYFVSCEEA